MRRWARIGPLVLLAVVALAVAAGQAGLLQGTPPSNLGVRDGRLAPPSATPNSVSSQAELWPDHPQREGARIAPLPLAGSAAQTIERIRRIVEAMPGSQVVEARADYLSVRFTTRIMRFVDDAEFWADPGAGVVQVRSASRVGRSDFGVNRARIEDVRAALARPG